MKHWYCQKHWQEWQTLLSAISENWQIPGLSNIFGFYSGMTISLTCLSCRSIGMPSNLCSNVFQLILHQQKYNPPASCAQATNHVACRLYHVYSYVRPHQINFMDDGFSAETIGASERFKKKKNDFPQKWSEQRSDHFFPKN